MHLLQIQHPRLGRRIGLVQEPEIVLFDKKYSSTYQLFSDIINQDKKVKTTIEEVITNERIDYDLIYRAISDWRLLTPIDCHDNPMQCILSGTGLTHKASAENRNQMHIHLNTGQLTDSMQMYLWGEKGGKPEDQSIGIQPEWFYKGNGFNLKAHGEHLEVPDYAENGGEEPEIAGIYLISKRAIPYRLGFAQANEFSDHVMEKKNYLYLAPSKLRQCAIGPELILNHDFMTIPGRVCVMRNDITIWSKDIQSGENAMSHSLFNLEYHHFKYAQHRIPGQLHVHFFGAGAFSFGENILLENGDKMYIDFDKMGRPLINPILINRVIPAIPEIRSLELYN